NTYFFIDKAQGFTNSNSLCATDDNKRLFVGTKEGYFVLNNDYFVQKRSFNNTLSITDLFVNNNKISNEEYGNNHIILPFNKNNIRLNFLVDNAKFKDRKSTRLNSSHVKISYAVFCLKKKIKRQ